MINLIGKVLHNRFRVDAFVASGGMSVVYRVWDLERNVPLAMKVLHMDLADDPSIMKRFQREARALQNLAHPHIVPFYGLYQSQDLIYLLEHYIDGPSMKYLLRQRRGEPLPIEETLIFLKALSTALGYAHNNGVVHCDIKPGNVMIDRVGNIYLTDFGVARHAESTTTTLGTAGTPAYMAPEQIRGDPVTPATDVYALGVVLYQLVTGHRPFAGNETESESSGATAAERVRYAHLRLAPADPREFNSQIPEGLAHVILKALAKEPGERYESVLDLFYAVCDTVGVAPGQLPDRISIPELDEAAALVLPDAAAAGAAAAMPYAQQPQYQAAEKNIPWLWIGVAAVGIILLIFGGILFSGGLPAITAPFAPETPTFTMTATFTAAYTATQAPTHMPTMTATFTRLPTDAPTDTARPTNTARPTDPPPPTRTPEPTTPPLAATYRVTIRNTGAAPLYAFRNEKRLGPNPILPNQYIWFTVNSGPAEFYGCQNADGTNCTSRKTYNITKDMEIRIP